VALVLELAESHGQPSSKGLEINLHLSHQELASLIGATRETVTLTLGRLQKEKLIQVERRKITILDLERLSAEESGAIPANGEPVAAQK
jgi:CRP/FNR family transcriptional regulator